MRMILPILILVGATVAITATADQRIAWVRNSDDSVEKRVTYQDDWSALDVAHKFGPAFTFRLLPIIVDADPAFDAATQTFDRAQVVSADEVRITKTVRALTEDELKELRRQARTDNAQARLGALVTSIKDGNNVTQNQLRLALSYLLAAQGITE